MKAPRAEESDNFFYPFFLLSFPRVCGEPELLGDVTVCRYGNPVRAPSNGNLALWRFTSTAAA